ncbi:hypothetical protein SAY87_010402 [Trapa incisa]|uniref:Uncharacterized protein n=1 Tax=Trapa incisa TaxID=236973 RepID=A0AAN7GJG8_9MYRT|nr:hypothetical protein SAY87_010402 [Trapa incisa]
MASDDRTSDWLLACKGYSWLGHNMGLRRAKCDPIRDSESQKWPNVGRLIGRELCKGGPETSRKCEWALDGQSFDIN